MSIEKTLSAQLFKTQANRKHTTARPGSAGFAVVLENVMTKSGASPAESRRQPQKTDDLPREDYVRQDARRGLAESSRKADDNRFRDDWQEDAQASFEAGQRRKAPSRHDAATSRRPADSDPPATETEENRNDVPRTEAASAEAAGETAGQAAAGSTAAALPVIVITADQHSEAGKQGSGQNGKTNAPDIHPQASDQTDALPEAATTLVATTNRSARTSTAASAVAPEQHTKTATAAVELPGGAAPDKPVAIGTVPAAASGMSGADQSGADQSGADQSVFAAGAFTARSPAAAMTTKESSTDTTIKQSLSGRVLSGGSLSGEAGSAADRVLPTMARRNPQPQAGGMNMRYSAATMIQPAGSGQSGLQASATGAAAAMNATPVMPATDGEVIRPGTTVPATGQAVAASSTDGDTAGRMQRHPQPAAQMTPQPTPQAAVQTRPQATPQAAVQTRPPTPQVAVQTRPQATPQVAVQTRPQATPQAPVQTSPQATPQAPVQTSPQATPQAAVQAPAHEAIVTGPLFTPEGGSRSGAGQDVLFVLQQQGDNKLARLPADAAGPDPATLAGDKTRATQTVTPGVIALEKIASVTAARTGSATPSAGDPAGNADPRLPRTENGGGRQTAQAKRPDSDNSGHRNVIMRPSQNAARETGADWRQSDGAPQNRPLQSGGQQQQKDFSLFDSSQRLPLTNSQSAVAHKNPASQIARAIVRELPYQPAGRLSVTLQPASLGRVSVEFARLEQNRINLKIMVSSRETFELIRSDIATLRQILGQLGYEDNNVGIDLGLNDNVPGSFADGTNLAGSRAGKTRADNRLHNEPDNDDRSPDDSASRDWLARVDANGRLNVRL